MTAFYPGSAAIDAYGNGGFRFAGMSHRGSILVLPSGILAWAVTPEALSIEDFAPVIAERHGIDLLLLGMGPMMARPPKPLREAIAASGIMLDCMATGHAVSTYNLLREEQRKVAAALIAVDHAG